MSLNYSHLLSSPIQRQTRFAIDRYVLRGECGRWLRVVLENDLYGAVTLAYARNLDSLPAVVTYIHQAVPDEARGSPAKVRAWRASKQSGATVDG